MSRTINRALAAQIVETVKDVCGYDINYINPNGMIYASTDEKRIGTYHEIGHQAAKARETIEVRQGDDFQGVHPGVNLPFIYNGDLIAVIGISGNPDEVRRYAHLAFKIMRLLLREHEIDLQNQNEKAQIHYVIRSLIGGTDLDSDYFRDFLRNYGLERGRKYATVVVQVNERYHPVNLSLVEQQVYHAFAQTGSRVYTFYYPKEYVLILEQEALKQWRYLFDLLAEKPEKILKIGVGSGHVIERQKVSYGEAQIALKSLTDSGVAEYDALDIEILSGEVSENTRRQYVKKTIGKLDKKEKEYLTAYFEHNQSLKETAEKLFIHKNTLQYQLDKIAEITGYNPRVFEEAAVLYVGLRIDRQIP